MFSKFCLGAFLVDFAYLRFCILGELIEADGPSQISIIIIIIIIIMPMIDDWWWMIDDGEGGVPPKKYHYYCCHKNY